MDQHWKRCSITFFCKQTKKKSKKSGDSEPFMLPVFSTFTRSVDAVNIQPGLCENLLTALMHSMPPNPSLFSVIFREIKIKEKSATTLKKNQVEHFMACLYSVFMCAQICLFMYIIYQDI